MTVGILMAVRATIATRHSTHERAGIPSNGPSVRSNLELSGFLTGGQGVRGSNPLSSTERETPEPQQ